MATRRYTNLSSIVVLV